MIIRRTEEIKLESLFYKLSNFLGITNLYIKMDDLSVIIRRCKRNNENKLNLSSRNMTMIP